MIVSAALKHAVEYKEDGDKEMSVQKFLWLALVMCVVIVGCKSKEKKDRQLIDEKQLVQKEVDSYYENSSAHYRLGRVYYKENNIMRAQEEFNLAIQFDPANWDAHTALIKTYTDTGENEKAHEFAKKAITFASTLDFNLIGLGKAFRNQGYDNYALQCFEKALALSPKSAEVNKHLGLIYLQKGENDKAEQYLTRSFQIDPSQADVAEGLGKLGIEVKMPRPK